METMNEQTLLVVEDEEIMRDSLVDWFSSEGRKVDAAVDGEEALAKFQLEKYDAMIIDLMLPGRNGLDVLAEVKKRNPTAKVVIVTAYPSYETAVEAMRRGASDYLPKPFPLEKLEASLRAAYQEIITPPDEITPPPVIEPLLEEENVTPCIWTQAGIVPKRMCTTGYQCCGSECDYHATMMKRDKYRDDPRIQPYLGQLTEAQAKHECRYVMCGDISSRACPSLYNCETCEFGQMLQDQVEEQLGIKEENRARKKSAREAHKRLASGGKKKGEGEPSDTVH
jgi:CheY-like chemotaxis protein